MAQDVGDLITRLGDTVAGVVDRIGDALFGAPKFARPARPATPGRPARPKPPPPCKNCKWYRRNIHTVCNHDLFKMTFSVRRAEEIVRDAPREALSLQPRYLRHYVNRGDVNVRHLAHVRRGEPGYMGIVRYKGRARRFIIEGHHRAYLARTGREPWRYYQLTEEETAKCRL